MLSLLAAKLRMLGKVIAQQNDFALYTLEDDGTGRIYKLNSDGHLDKKLNTLTFEECEVRKYFILATDIVREPGYKPHLWVQGNDNDILDGYDVKYLEFDVNQDLPIIGVASYLKILVINKFGEVKCIDMVGHGEISSNIPIGIDRNRKEYVIYNRYMLSDGSISDIEIARWSFDFKSFELIYK